MKTKLTALVDEHLQSLQGMQEAGTDDFFYTRLKARMEKNLPQQGWGFPLKPVWVVGTLVLLLAVNGIMLTQQFTLKKSTAAISASYTLHNFIDTYNLGI